MLKYANTGIVFQEFPNEVTLAINISGCPCRCPGCHSQFLWNDEGIELTDQETENLINKEIDSITCIGLMGGDAAPEQVNQIALHIKKQYPGLKIGWYSGRTILSKSIDLRFFDYIKIGPYLKHLGGLKSERTNQRMYKILEDGSMEDITPLFRHSPGLDD